MLFSTSTILSCAALFVTSVNAHGAMVAVTGANGVTAMGMGIIPTTPRDGTRRNPFQTDTSIIRTEEIESGEAGPCGRTLAGGSNNVPASVAAASSAGLPSMGADGSVQMTIHQINGDGAGPYTCEISTDATGTNFVPMTVTTNVPGRRGNSDARAQDFPLVAQAAPGTACTGGPNGDACIVRCQNPARAGPFGGCAVVTSADPPAAAIPPPAAAIPPPAAAVPPPAAAVPPPAAAVPPPAAAVPPEVISSPAVSVPATVIPPAVSAPATVIPPEAVPSSPVAPPPVGQIAPPAAVVPPAVSPPASVVSPAPVAPVNPDIAAAEAEEEAADATDAQGPLGALQGIPGLGNLAQLIGNKRDASPDTKRFLSSRIVAREHVGKWI